MQKKCNCLLAVKVYRNGCKNVEIKNVKDMNLENVCE